MINVACCLIINGKNEILLAQKKSGQWEFPGGKQQAGETILQCAEREIKEELGITIQAQLAWPINHPIFTIKGDFKLQLVQCRLVSGNIELTEHLDVEWVSALEIPKYLAENDDLKLWMTNKSSWDLLELT